MNDKQISITPKTELHSTLKSKAARSAYEIASAAASAAENELLHVENHATLCQLQRDVAGIFLFWFYFCQ